MRGRASNLRWRTATTWKPGGGRPHCRRAGSESLAAYALEAILRLNPNATRDKDLRALLGELNVARSKTTWRKSRPCANAFPVVAKLRNDYPPEESQAAIAVAESALAHVVKPELSAELLKRLEGDRRALDAFAHLSSWREKISSTSDAENEHKERFHLALAQIDSLDLTGAREACTISSRT